MQYSLTPSTSPQCFLAHPISKVTGRVLSGLGTVINSKLCCLTVVDWSDDGYEVEVRHNNNGMTERVWIEGDLPKHVQFRIARKS